MEYETLFILLLYTLIISYERRFLLVFGLLSTYNTLVIYDLVLYIMPFIDQIAFQARYFQSDHICYGIYIMPFIYVHTNNICSTHVK